MASKTIVLLCFSLILIEMKFFLYYYVIFARKSMNMCNDQLKINEIIIEKLQVFKHIL